MEEDDFKNSPLGAGNLGLVAPGGVAVGELEYNGDRDVFGAQLIAGLTYTIEQRGEATQRGSLYDPYLYLVNGLDTVLAQDDDGGTGRDALITYTPAVTDEYYISARAIVDAYTGDYKVLVSAGRGTEDEDSITGIDFYDDPIEALGGDDFVSGGSGDDFLDGGVGDDELFGERGADILYGRGGGDFLFGGRGNDILRGSGGDDLLRGGFDADILRGGAGEDIFQFLSVKASTSSERDRLVAGNGGDAFVGAGDAFGDLFDLSSIDADTTRGGIQAFDFGGTSRGGAGVVWFENSGRDTVLRANVDDDNRSEFVVEIEDGRSVSASDYSSADFLSVV